MGWLPRLFGRGDLACLLSPAVAIVGSRRASHAGMRATTEMAERLAAAGYTVCSGLALGIDAAARRRCWPRVSIGPPLRATWICMRK